MDVARASTDPVPLCVDLDGTLSRRDTLVVAVLDLLRRRPYAAAAFPLWLLRGRAGFKRAVAARVEVDPAALPYNRELVEWLRAERAAGRSLWLVTAADRAVADSIARHFGLFDGVLASDGTRNLKAVAKLQALRERFPGGFDYAGNSAADLPVWREARGAIVVNASPRILRAARAGSRVLRVIP